MITIFNQRELTITFSAEQQAKIRDLLCANKIKYKLKIVNRNSPTVFGDTRASLGRFGEDMAFANEYIIYVYKKDYDFAQAVINGKCSG